MAKDVKTETNAQGLKKPLCFVENKGQVTDENDNARNDVQYKLSTPGMSLYLGNGQLHYQFKKIEGLGSKTPKASTYRMDVTLVGANPNAVPEASDMQAYHENYYYPQFGEDGLHVNSFGKITYKNVYPNIDWVIYVRNNKVEYDFVVHEGGNANDIKLQYGGATKLTTTKDGSLSAETPMGKVVEKTPYAYENATGNPVAANFKLENNTVTFNTGNHTGAFTIDPYLEWGTYFGGTGEDVATSVVQTGTGIVLVGGYSASTGLAHGTAPTPYLSVNAGVTYDAFLAVYSATGALTYATYYGGTGTNTQATGVAINSGATDVYVTGFTTATNLASPGAYQTTNNGLNDAFLVKFSVAGVRQWCTYFGGTNDDYAYGVALDINNDIYITGQTLSTAGIASSGAYQTSVSGPNDAFIAKFTTAGARSWSTYYGGSAQESAYGVACDASANVIITGQTNSIVGIATTGAADAVLNGTNDAFVAQFSTAGALNWGTYFGGDSTEQANGVVCDPTTGSIAIVGSTTSSTGIASTYAAQSAYGGGQQDAFVAYFSNSGTPVWSTYFGGPGVDYGQGICLDSFQNIVISGGTFSSSGIATTGSYQATIGGDYDAFVSKFDAYGQNLWGTYYGGNFYDYANAVTCAPRDQIVIAGYTSSTSGISTAGAAQAAFGGGTYDAFVTKFESDTLVIISQPFTDTLVCAGGLLNVNYTANFNFHADNVFTIQMSDITGSFATPITIGAVASNTSGTIACSIPSTAAGTGYVIRIVASDPAYTSPNDIYNIDVVATLTPTTASASTPVCAGGTLYLYDSSSYIVTGYTWVGPNGYFSNAQDPVISFIDPTFAGTYTVTTSHNGCPDVADTVSVVVNTFTPTTPADSASIGCVGGTIFLFANPDTAVSGITYNWTGPDGFTSTLQNPSVLSASPLNQGYYFVTDTLAGCPSATNFIYVAVNDVTPSTISITANPGDTICKGQPVTFTATSTNAGIDPGYQWTTGTGTPIVGAVAATLTSLDLTNGSTISCVLTSNVQCPTAVNYTSNVITLTVLDNSPLVHIVATPGDVISSGETVTISSAVVNPGTAPYYEWLVNGDTVTTSLSDTLILPDVTTRDTVTLIVFNDLTCSSPDSAISNTIIIRTNTAVPVINALDNVSLFPNPNNGGFTVKGDISALNTNTVTLEISNAIGQTVYEQEVAGKGNNLDKEINLTTMPAGVYLLNVTGNGQSKVIRFSIEH